MSYTIEQIHGYGFMTGKSGHNVKNNLTFLKNHADTITKISAFSKNKDALDKAQILADYLKSLDLSKIPDDLAIEDYDGTFGQYDDLYITTHDYFEYTEDNGLNLIAMIIAQETGMSHVEYQGGAFDGDTECILFPSLMPWDYNVFERSIYESDVKSLLQPYADELHAVDEIDYNSVLYEN